MTKETLFAMWAPEQSIWSQWAKPVVFAHYDERFAAVRQASGSADAGWVGAAAQMAVVIDLPGASSVEYGMALAKRGYRPVPLFNAAPMPPRQQAWGRVVPSISEANERFELVDVTSILEALAGAAEELFALGLPMNAPPAFLLDANRRFGTALPLPGRFDNRSVSLPGDFPSASFLAQRGIRDVLLIQRAELQPQSDLAHALLRWQQAGLTIKSRPIEGGGAPVEISVNRPSHFRNLWYRLLAGMRLNRNPLGGFGREIPLYDGSAG